MTSLHLKPETIVATKTFVKGGALALLGVISAIVAVTLIYAWFFT